MKIKINNNKKKRKRKEKGKTTKETGKILFPGRGYLCT